MPEIETENIDDIENIEESSTIDPSSELLVIKAGDSKIFKTKQIKPQPERPAVEYRAAIVGSQEITITVKDLGTACATIDRLCSEGWGGGTYAKQIDSPLYTLRVSIEPGKDNLANFREAFKRTKHKDHGNKSAIEAGKAAKQAAKTQEAHNKKAEKDLKLEKKVKEKERKDSIILEGIMKKDRDRVLKEKLAGNNRLEVRIKQDEATLKAIRGIVGKRGYSSPEADEEIEQRVAAIAADKESLATSRREIKKEVESREKVVITEVTGTTEESSELVGGDFIHDETSKDLEDDLDGFGPYPDGDVLNDTDMLAGM